MITGSQNEEPNHLLTLDVEVPWAKDPADSLNQRLTVVYRT
jgi:hypothetical protein